MKNADEGVRARSAVRLGALRDAEAVEPLIAALADESDLVRRAAIRALADIRDPRSFEAVERLLRTNLHWYGNAPNAP